MHAHVGGAGKAVYVYDASTEELLGQLDGLSKVQCVSVFETGAEQRSGVIAAADVIGTLRVWDAGGSTRPAKCTILPPITS